MRTLWDSQASAGDEHKHKAKQDHFKMEKEKRRSLPTREPWKERRGVKSVKKKKKEKEKRKLARESRMRKMARDGVWDRVIVDQVDGDQEERESKRERRRDWAQWGAAGAGGWLQAVRESTQGFTYTSTIAHSIKPNGAAKRIHFCTCEPKFSNLYIL